VAIGPPRPNCKIHVLRLPVPSVPFCPGMPSTGFLKRAKAGTGNRLPLRDRRPVSGLPQRPPLPRQTFAKEQTAIRVHSPQSRIPQRICLATRPRCLFSRLTRFTMILKRFPIFPHSPAGPPPWAAPTMIAFAILPLFSRFFPLRSGHRLSQRPSPGMQVRAKQCNIKEAPQRGQLCSYPSHT
jgi:hypothetical protein